MKRILLIATLIFLAYTACGGPSRITHLEQEKNQDQDISVPVTTGNGSGEVPSDPCSQGGPKCKKNYDEGIVSRNAMPRQLWCHYGYPGADEYCRVKINEKAFNNK